MSDWTNHVGRWRDCTACPLGTQRDRICLARGTVPCVAVFVGEAPGASENAIGQPFVGPAGHLLDAIVASALSGPQQQIASIAFTNLVACYPRDAKERGDNEPEISEIQACRPRLAEFIALCRPRLLVFVGQLAETYGPAAIAPAITYAGGTVGDHPTLRRWVSITHPAAILRMPLAQKQMAVQRCVVQLKCALDAVLQ